MSYVYVILHERTEQVVTVFPKKYLAKSWLKGQPKASDYLVQSWAVSSYGHSDLVRTTPGDFFRDEVK